MNKTMCKQCTAENVTMYMVNLEHSREFLADKPHRQFLDLAGVYRWKEGCSLETAGEPVTLQQMRQLGLTEEELFEMAMKNVEEDCKLLYCGCGFNGFDESIVSTSTVCVTNRDTYWGSGAMMSRNIMNRLAARFNSDVMIMPSSVHELMVCIYHGEPEQIEYMKAAVLCINSDPDMVPPEVWLSDNVYLFRRDTQEVTIA